MSWQLPSEQTSTPGPKQRVGPDVGLVVEVVDVIADQENVVLFTRDDEVLLAHVYESLQARVVLLE